MDRKVIHGDCLGILKTLVDESIDAVVTDPPAGIGFMGKAWDKDKGGRNQWVAWLQEIMEECLRVLKPGGHALVWALPKTSHWTALALEDAGFEIRDRVSHLFGTGFPKNHDVAKAIDKLKGATPKIVGENPNHRPDSGLLGVYAGGNTGNKFITETTSPEAQRFKGFGTAMKPAIEDWWLVRKPFKGTVAKNVLKHGTGALNIDGTRIGAGNAVSGSGNNFDARRSGQNREDRPALHGQSSEGHNKGRWPAHLVLSHHPECEVVGTKVEKGHKGYPKGPGGKSVHWSPDSKRSEDCRTEAWEGIPDQEVLLYECHDDCPIGTLDEQSGMLTSGKMKAGTKRKNREGWAGPMPAETGEATFGDSGGASRFFMVVHPGWDAKSVEDPHQQNGIEPAQQSAERPPHGDSTEDPKIVRFFYTAKPAKKERNAGLPEGEKNTHPTVKSVKLMRWLVRLITPPGGTVLDPFCGSGSTGVACAEEGFGFLGIEAEGEYVTIAEKRIAHAEEEIE